MRKLMTYLTTRPTYTEIPDWLYPVGDDVKGASPLECIAILATVACLILAASGDWVDFPEIDGCTTDTECAELCPEGSRDLPADHPDFCDGGPQ